MRYVRRFLFGGALASIVIASVGWLAGVLYLSGILALLVLAHGVAWLAHRYDVRHGPVPSFTCPRCGKVSHNGNDVREGYCGACRDFTGRKDPGLP